MTAPAVDTTEITLADIAPVCELKNGPVKACVHVAEWVAIKRCCGKVYLICDPHARKTEQLLTEGMNIGCKPCKVYFTKADGGPYLSLERL